MKSKEEILKRAVILLAFSDRCALEKKTIDGVKRTLKEKEMQRQAIIDWLMRMGYYDSIFENEKQIFNKKITDISVIFFSLKIKKIGIMFIIIPIF